MYSNRNSAYDFSVFEERKVQKVKKVIRFPHKKQRRLVERRAKLALGMSILSVFLLVAGVCSFLIYGQAIISELTIESANVSKKLAESQSMYTQLKMKKEASDSLNIAQSSQDDIQKYRLEKDATNDLKNKIPVKDVAEVK